MEFSFYRVESDPATKNKDIVPPHPDKCLTDFNKISQPPQYRTSSPPHVKQKDAKSAGSERGEWFEAVGAGDLALVLVQATIKRASKAVKTPLTVIKNAFRMQQMAKWAGQGESGEGGGCTTEGTHQIE